MKLRKKHFIIASVILIFLLGIKYMYTHDKNYVSNEDKDEKRIESMEKLEEEAQLGEHEDISEGKYAGEELDLINRNEFIDSFKGENIDKGIIIANVLPNNLMYLNIINEDCNNENIEKYFETNKDVIEKLYSIGDLESFKNFYSKIKELGKSLNSFEIKKDTVEDFGNSIIFDIVLNGDKKVVLNVKAVISDMNFMNVNFFIQ